AASRRSPPDSGERLQAAAGRANPRRRARASEEPRMKFDTPAGENPIDRQKAIGRSTPRIDGPLKTTGTARYAYERNDVAPRAAYGYVVTSGIAKGRIRSIDVAAAKTSPGVLAVVTAQTAGKLGQAK